MATERRGVRAIHLAALWQPLISCRISSQFATLQSKTAVSGWNAKPADETDPSASANLKYIVSWRTEDNVSASGKGTLYSYAEVPDEFERVWSLGVDRLSPRSTGYPDVIFQRAELGFYLHEGAVEIVRWAEERTGESIISPSMPLRTFLRRNELPVMSTIKITS